MKAFTADELAKHDGSNARLPVLLSVQGMVFDVTPGKSFYGPGGPYATFAGKEVARALALMSTSADDCSGDVSDLAPSKIEILRDWERKFQGKYCVVGAMEGSGIDLSAYEPPMGIEVMPDTPAAPSPLKAVLFGGVAVLVAAAALGVAVLAAKKDA